MIGKLLLLISIDGCMYGDNIAIFPHEAKSAADQFYREAEQTRIAL